MGPGGDAQRDYWSTCGNADMLDRTWQLAFTSGFRSDGLIGHTAAVMDRPGGRTAQHRARNVIPNTAKMCHTS